MNDRPHIATGVIGAILVALCCAAPLLVVALGSTSLTAWLMNAYYVLVPAILVLLAADDLALATSHLVQSSSASRFTAGASRFFILSQSGERPER